MKNPIEPFGGKYRRSVSLSLSTLLLSLAASTADVMLTFDSTTEGVAAGGDGISMLWDSYGGGCLALTVATDWHASCAVINLNDDTEGNPAPAELVALRTELKQALITGGTMSYKITVETDAFGAGPYPQWFQTIYQGRSWAGWDQGLRTPQGQLDFGFNNAPLPAKVEFLVNYPIEAAQSTVADAIAQFRGDSPAREIHLGLNTQNVGGSVRYYIDDFKIAANVVAAPPVIPNVKLTPVVPGLNIISSGVGQYDRQCVRTTEGSDQSWVGGTFPKTYEMTIADYPTMAGYESVIYFVPGTGIPSTTSNPDYTEPVCTGAWIYPNGDGTGSMALRYKDGPINSNGITNHEYWVGDPAPSHGIGGQLASVFSSKFIGTWKITFTSDTDFTLTGPDGSTSSGAFHPTAAAKYAGGMYVYFGNVPSQPQNIGLSAVYSHIKITGTGYPIDENIALYGMSGDFEVAAAVPTSVIQVTSDSARFWIDWTLPATDFQIMQSADLGVSDPWVVVPMLVTHKTKFGQARLLQVSEVANPANAFFRLMKPATP